MPTLLPRDRFVVAVIAMGALLAVLCGVRTAVWSWGADSGTFYQLILHAFSGFSDGPERGSHLRFHWSPTLALLWPVVRLAPTVLPLQLVQVALIVGCAPLLRVLVRPYLGERLATLAGTLCLLYPPLLAVGFGEFHELALWPILALTMLWSADRRRWGIFAFATIAAVGVREDVCILVAMIGAVFVVLAALGRKEAALLAGAPADRRATALAGLGAIAAGLGSLGFYFGIVVVHVGPWAPSHFYRYAFADGPLQLLGALVSEPAVALPAIVQLGKLTYLLEALVPLALLPFASAWSLLALPGLAVCVLSAVPLAWRMGSHYVALWAPFLVLGAAFGMRRAGVIWSRTAVAMSAIGLIAFNPMHPLHYLRPLYRDLAAARSTFPCVPLTAEVSTHDEWYSEIVGRWPQATISRSDASWLVYAADYDNAYYRGILAPDLQRDLADGSYVLRCRNGRVAAYERVLRRRGGGGIAAPTGDRSRGDKRAGVRT